MEGDRTKRSKKTDKSQEDKRGQEEKGSKQRGIPGSIQQTLNIVYLNAKSLISKINDLEVLVNEQNPDIILITETWLNRDISNSILQLEGYFIESTLRCDRTDTTNGIGGGLLVYVKHGNTILQTNNMNTFNQFCQFKVLSDNNQDLNVTLV